MRHCCKDCHFLASGLKQVGRNPQPWNKELREHLKPLEKSGTSGRSNSGCYKGIWLDSFLPTDDNNSVLIKPFREAVRKDRKENCFFVEYQEGMTFEAAEELQRLEYDNRHLKRGYRNTQRSLTIATIGLALGALLELAQLARDLDFLKLLWQLLWQLP